MNQTLIMPLGTMNVIQTLIQTELKSGLPRMKKYLFHHCPRVYRRKFSLKRHLERHIGGAEKFKCAKCNSSFYRKDLLQRHIRISCQKSRRTNSVGRISLQKTQVIEESLKAKSVRSKQECLRISCASSNGEYKCSICLQIYRHKFTLKRHMDQYFDADFGCIQ